MKQVPAAQAASVRIRFYQPHRIAEGKGRHQGKHPVDKEQVVRAEKDEGRPA
jgi:hypothetical protein